MKPRATYLLVVLISLVFFMTGCREPQDVVFRTIKNVSVEKLGFNSSTLNADLVYYNPNNFSLELNRTDLAIYVDSSLLGHSSQDFQIKVPKRDEFTFPLKVELDMKNLLKNGLAILFNKEIKLRLLGKVRLGKAGVFKTFPVDYTTIQTFSLFE